MHTVILGLLFFLSAFEGDDLSKENDRSLVTTEKLLRLFELVVQIAEVAVHGSS